MSLKLGIAFAIILCASHARAERIYSVAVVGGYALEGRTIAVGTTSAYRAGVGVRAGVSFPKLYLGLAFTHHLGTHQVASGAGSSFDARYSSTLVGPEVGYEATVSPRVTLRPYFGGGVLYEYSRTTLNGSEFNDSHARSYVTFGLASAYHVDRAFLGLELRGIISPFSDPRKWTPGAFATIGYAF